MIGLRKTQNAVYDLVVRLSAKSCLPPTTRDVQRHFRRRSSTVPRSIHCLCQRGFLFEDRFGALTVLPPPHDRIIAQVLGKSTISREKLLGPSKDARCILLRRTISKILRNDYGYSYVDIGRALNRSDRSIVEYFRPASYVRHRIEWRRNRYLKSKTQRSEMKVAA
jgi:hypothetical protein